MAAMGSAIGLGNIWRFPYITYKSGGGAFLIPYLFALITAGIPLIVLEIGMGSKTRRSAPFAFGKLLGKKRYEWIGWWATIGSLILVSYYSVIMSWTLSYMIKAPTQAWGADPNTYFMGNFLGWTGNPLKLGGIRLEILAALLAIWIINWLIIKGGVKKGIEKVTRVMIPLMWIIVLVLIIRAISLPGSMEGINWYLNPDFSKLTNPRIWLDAYGQIFFTLSVGQGAMIIYGSYLKKESDIVNNSFIIALADSAFAFIAGFAVFGTLGFMAGQIGVGVDEVVVSGAELAFVTYPKAISMLGVGGGAIGTLFFFLLLIAGLSSSISLTEVSTGALMGGFKISRKKAVSIVCGVGLLMGIVYTTGGGFGWLDLIDNYISYFSLALIGLLEALVIGWIFGARRLRVWVNFPSEISIGPWWDWCLKLVTPFILGATLVLASISLLKEGYGGYPNLALLLAFLLIIGGMFVAYGLFKKEKIDVTSEKFEV
jgi:NSS family neurotransmitter:Na+ symporter